MMRNKLQWIWVTSVFLVAALGWIVAPHDPYTTNVAPVAQPPGPLVLGSDTLGRDLFSRILHGGPVTLLTGAAAGFLAWCLGGVLGMVEAVVPQLGLLSGMFTGALLALPVFLIALTILTALGSTLTTITLAAGIAQAGIASQVWRGVVGNILKEQYVDGSIALGAGRFHILRYHVLPNALRVMLAYSLILFAQSVLLISGLTFLGFGGDPASPDWGNLMADGRRALRYAPWIALAPAVCLITVTSALNTAARLINRR
jgi:peptide/nickel transport system permease protein